MNDLNNASNGAENMTAAKKLNWMTNATWADDTGRYDEFRHEVDALASLAQGYPDRHAQAIGALYGEMRSA